MASLLMHHCCHSCLTAQQRDGGRYSSLVTMRHVAFLQGWAAPSVGLYDTSVRLGRYSSLVKVRRVIIIPRLRKPIISPGWNRRKTKEGKFAARAKHNHKQFIMIIGCEGAAAVLNWTRKRLHLLHEKNWPRITGICQEFAFEKSFNRRSGRKYVDHQHRLCHILSFKKQIVRWFCMKYRIVCHKTFQTRMKCGPNGMITFLFVLKHRSRQYFQQMKVLCIFLFASVLSRRSLL